MYTRELEDSYNFLRSKEIVSNKTRQDYILLCTQNAISPKELASADKL